MSSYYEEVFDDFTDRQLVSILEEQNYEAVRVLSSGLIQFRYDNLIYHINNSYDDSMDIFMVFDDFDISFKEINEWNAEKRFVKVYKDDGKVFLTMHLDTGITEAYLIHSIRKFITIQALFSLSKLSRLAKLFEIIK